MSGDELSYVDAVGQAELVRDRTCSPAELVEAAITRIERYNPTLNAFVSSSFEQALDAARRSNRDGAFRGVPFAFKDYLGETAGDPSHAGMRLLRERNWISSQDCFLAGDLRAAGLVFLGRTNTPELANSVTTEPLAYGPTTNPWDHRLSAGGSSGGSAAAVAAGLVPAAHANDTGGSIRIPAAHCGLVGLKPSRGRTAIGPDAGGLLAESSQEGVLTRTVRDTTALLDVIAVPHAGAPFEAAAPVGSFLSRSAQRAGRSRIGIRTTLPGTTRSAHPEHVRTAEAAARLLEEQGHVVEASYPAALDDATVDAFHYSLIGVSFAQELERWSARLGSPITAADVEPATWRFAEMGRALSATDLVAAEERLQAHARRLCSWWADGFDLLVTPTTSGPPPSIGVLAPLADQPPGLSRDITAFARPWNITGQPAISLPLARSGRGLPIGVQLVAAHGREDLLLQVATAFEQATPWADRIPPGYP
jgi:amidase